MKKTTEVAVVETKEVAKVEAKQLPETKVNSEKENKVLDLSGVKAVFTEVGIIPKYTDSTNYVGCGTRANTFSVNIKKTKYNVFCGNEEFDWVKASGIKDCNMVANGNSVDKTRPNYIEVKDTEVLKSLLKVILDHNAKLALAK